MSLEGVPAHAVFSMTRAATIEYLHEDIRIDPSAEVALKQEYRNAPPARRASSR